jgi:hypothetical protein
MVRSAVGGALALSGARLEPSGSLLLRMRISLAEASCSTRAAGEFRRAYAVFSIGGALGRISANATWMMPPASPSATPIRHAMV